MTEIFAAADAADERFALEFQVAGGPGSASRLSSCHGTRFEEALPVRPFRFEKGLRSFAGWWYFATTGAHVGFESWLERDHLMLMDFDPGVRAVSSQPFWLRWRDGEGRSRRHAPDFFARRADGTGVVVDVRPDDRIPRQGRGGVRGDGAGVRGRGLGVPAGRGRSTRCWSRTCGGCRATGTGGAWAPEVAAVAAGGVRRRRRAGRGGRAGRGPAGGAAGAVPPDVAAAVLAADLTAPLGMSTVVLRGRGPVSGARRRQVWDRRPDPGRRRPSVGDQRWPGPGSGWPTRRATVRTVTLAELVSDPRVRGPGRGPAQGTRPGIGLDGPACRRGGGGVAGGSAHIVEVVYGLRPDAPPGAGPRPEYDPERTSLTGREKAKAAELSAAGRPVRPARSSSRRQRWEAARPGRRWSTAGRPGGTPPAGRADERVVEAMRQAIGEATEASSRTTGLRDLAGRGRSSPRHGYGRPRVPSGRTFYRLFGALAHGQARDRIGLAPAGRWPAGRRARSARCRPRRPARWCRSTPPRWTCWCCWTTGSPAGSS